MTLLCICVRAGSRDDGKGKPKDIRPITLHGFPGDETDFGRRKAQVACVSGKRGARGDDSPQVSLQYSSNAGVARLAAVPCPTGMDFGRK